MRPPSLAISLAIHSGAFLALMHSSGVRLPEPGKSEYQMAIAGKEEKLVWYKLNQQIPNISPPVMKKDRRPIRAESVAKQKIASSSRPRAANVS